jgi:protein-tyrosine phosphatase
VLILNSPSLDQQTKKIQNNDTIPRNWRSTQDNYIEKRKENLPEPSRIGLDQLFASGSAQFSIKQFDKILKASNTKKLLVVDLRQESHGFTNDLAISWYAQFDAMNDGKTLSEIEEDERNRLIKLSQIKNIELTKWSSIKAKTGKSSFQTTRLKVKVSSAQTERQFVIGQKAEYLRIPAPDHQRPRDQDIDMFISQYKKLQSNYWIHFHCAAGMGRTTTFLSMYDMMRNSSKLSMNDIVKRQWLIGGADLLDTSKPNQKRGQWSKERVEFLDKFYQYAKNQAPEFKLTWSEWSKQNK